MIMTVLKTNKDRQQIWVIKGNYIHQYLLLSSACSTHDKRHTTDQLILWIVSMTLSKHSAIYLHISAWFSKYFRDILHSCKQTGLIFRNEDCFNKTAFSYLINFWRNKSWVNTPSSKLLVAYLLTYLRERSILYGSGMPTTWQTAVFTNCSLESQLYLALKQNNTSKMLFWLKLAFSIM